MSLAAVPSGHQDADSGALQKMAREYYLIRLQDHDEDLSGAALAERFHRSERWGRDQISAARAAAGLPARVSASAGKGTPAPTATAIIVTPSAPAEEVSVEGPVEDPAAGAPAGAAAGSDRQDPALPAGTGQLIA